MFGGHNHFGSEVIKILGCRLLLQDQIIQASYDFMIGSPPHGKSLPSQVGGHRHWGSGDMIFLLVEDQDSTCCRLKLVQPCVSSLFPSRRCFCTDWQKF